MISVQYCSSLNKIYIFSIAKKILCKLLLNSKRILLLISEHDIEGGEWHMLTSEREMLCSDGISIASHGDTTR